MSQSNALQKMLFDRLTGDAPLVALIGGRVYDAPAPGVIHPYVSFGPSATVPADAELLILREETLQIDVWSKAKDGQRECKAIVDAIKTSLHRWQGMPVTGAVADMRVGLTRILPDPADGVTHGVVQVEIDVEEG